MTVEILATLSFKDCRECLRRLPVSQFRKDKRGKNGLRVHCKSCQARLLQEWRHKNTEKVRATQRKYLLKYRATHLGKRLWEGIRNRCRNPNHSNYKNYGARGIELRLTRKELCHLFDEQRASLISETVHTHRIDSSGHYERGNILFMSKSTHLKLHGKRRRELKK